MRRLFLAMAAFALAGSVALAQQAELDRSVQRVYGSVIMASDVRQVRLLKLAGGADSDAAAQTALENRLLILREVSLGNVPEPAADRIAAKRDAWRSTWPPSTDVNALLTRAGMTPQALDGWFRDELRIEAYLESRFPQTSDPRRADRINGLISDLRRRANLSGK